MALAYGSSAVASSTFMVVRFTWKYPSTTTKNTGTKNTARKVEVSMPPITPVPTACCAPEPAPLEMASGNTPLLDASPLTGLRSVAANLAQEAPDALRASAHYGSLLLSALLLFGLCLLLNAVAEGVRSRLRRRLAGL